MSSVAVSSMPQPQSTFSLSLSLFKPTVMQVCSVEHVKLTIIAGEMRPQQPVCAMRAQVAGVHLSHRTQAAKKTTKSLGLDELVCPDHVPFQCPKQH